MKALFRIGLPLLLASAACVSAINTAPASTRFFKREPTSSSTITSSRPGPTVNSQNTIYDPSFQSLGWTNQTDNVPWTANTGCSCAQLSPKDCYDRCGYFGINRTEPETDEPYSFLVHNGFATEKMIYDWPDTVSSSFFHRGGAGRSYKATPTDDNPYFDYPPFQLNASVAAALYPGDWPEKVYMWWFTYTDGTNPVRAVSCLCAAGKDCGCAPEGWLEVEGFDAQGTAKNITSATFLKIPEVVVNGTATADELKEEEKLNGEKEERERVAKEWEEKVEREKAERTDDAEPTDIAADADSGARGLVVRWGFLGLALGVGFVCQY